MDEGELAAGESSAALIEFVCLARHRGDAGTGAEYTLDTFRDLPAFCARAATSGPEWIRVPATPLDRITTGKMEDRPPEPARPRGLPPLPR
jgi:hypothetical protein